MSTKLGEVSDWFDVVQDGANALGNLASNLPGVAAYGRAFCRVVAGTPGGQALQGANIGNACSAFWQDDGITPPTNELPFTGGQCPGTLYEFTWNMDFQTTNCSTDVVQDNPGIERTLRVTGPVTSGRVVEVPGGCNGGPRGYSYELLNGDTVLGAMTVVTNFPQAVFASAFTTNSIGQVPVNGPDDCGNPPDAFIPSPNAPGVNFGDPQSITGPDGNNYNITPFDFEVGDNNEVNIPFEINGAPFNFGPEGSPTPLTPGDTTEGAPQNGGDEGGERDVPEAPAGSRCIAIAFVFSGFSADRGTVINSGPNQRLYAVFGNAAIKVRTDTGSEYYLPNQDLNSERSLIAIPVEGLTCTGFKVNLETGLSYSATPIYRSETEEN